jgi:hypothetical protein
MKDNNLKAHRKELIKNRKITPQEIESNSKLWDSKVFLGSEDLMLASKYSEKTTISSMDFNKLTFHDFLQNSSAQSVGKFGEFLFNKFCDFNKIICTKKHENGIDFIIHNNIKIDVKAVRSLKSNPKERFRRVVKEKQLPNVIYAYLIFWKNLIELRVEVNDFKYGSYDCFIDGNLLESTWALYDKKSIKFIDKHHVEITKQLKNELTNWIADKFDIKARVIQRKVNSAINKRGGGEWGADNFYENSNKHKLVVLLAVENGRVAFIHSYPTNEHMEIPRQLKPVGTNPVEIWCYKPNMLPERYKFNDIEDFKLKVKERFNFTERKRNGN